MLVVKRQEQRPASFERKIVLQRLVVQMEVSVCIIVSEYEEMSMDNPNTNDGIER